MSFADVSPLLFFSSSSFFFQVVFVEFAEKGKRDPGRKETHLHFGALLETSCVPQREKSYIEM